jgi:hypothetical protein
MTERKESKRSLHAPDCSATGCGRHFSQMPETASDFACRHSGAEYGKTDHGNAKLDLIRLACGRSGSGGKDAEQLLSCKNAKLSAGTPTPSA